MLKSPFVPLSSSDRHIVATVVVTRLKLLGGAALIADSGPVSGRAAQRHRLALLALLSTTRRLYRSRDQLVAFLWPDADAEHGRKLLSDSIYRINQALGGDVVMGPGEDVRLNRGRLGSDLAEFEAAMDAKDWRRAVELYAGPFLDGFFLPGAAGFDQWLEAERAQYARAAGRALEALAVEARDAGRSADAVDWWQRLAALVPDDSRVAMELMRALEASGNRAGALRHARVHSVLLRESLGVEPDRSVQELADQIARRSNTIAGATPSRAATPAARVVTSSNVTLPAAAASTSVVAPVADGPVLGHSIAVLPFSNVSDSESNSYFADGISEELMYLLTRTPGLRVASRTSAFACRDLKLDVREVAARLHVAWILEGSVRRSGDMLRIVAQLTDARNGYQVWSESFDRKSSDVFAIQAEIAGAIANRLAPTLGGRGAAAAGPGTGASSPDTHDLYLQARHQWHRRTEAALTASVALFEQVVARDPSYVCAWAGLADAYAVMAFYDYAPPREAFPRADAAARHAILLDPSYAAPYATLAFVDTYHRWDWRAAEEGFRRAIDLDPTYSVARQWYGNLLTARGRFSEAEREMRRAAELDPLSMIAHAAIGWMFMFADQNDRAIQHLGSALKLDPHFCLAHYWMGLAFIRKGRPLEGIPFLRYVVDLSGAGQNCSMTWTALARAYASAGDLDAARTILADLLEQERAGRYISSFLLGKVYQALGDIPAALTRFERAHADRARSLVFLSVDPQLRPLASEPRFRRLMELVEQPLAR